ncbi:hypothetical protein AgCh_035640 [Apium graveolens]
MAMLTVGAISFIWTTSKSSSSSQRFKQASSPSASPQEANVVHSCRCSLQLSEPVPKNVNSAPVFDCADGVIKRGKFAVYYYDDDAQEEDYYRGNVVCAETEYNNVIDGSVTFCCRELNMGWYRYLDLTVFSGNVVKLWD